jgi:hypothetical protein
MKTTSDIGARLQTPGLPHGLCALLFDTVIPSGWLLADSTNGTPDTNNRIMVGASALQFGAAGGTADPTTTLSHAGMAVANHAAHVVTQASAHSDHTVTQPETHTAHVVTQSNAHGTHSSVGAHTHDSHSGTGNTTANTRSIIQNNFTHTSQGAHTHDVHSVHTGAALDAHIAHSGWGVNAHSTHSGAALDAHSAHSVTNPSNHAIIKHRVQAWIMWN